MTFFTTGTQSLVVHDPANPGWSGALAGIEVIQASPPSAPALNRTVPTTLSDGVSFLVQGPGATQVGVADGALDPARIAVVRGVVRAQSGPVAGVAVRIGSHPELGNTSTLVDGSFAFVLNGGEQSTLAFTAPGVPEVHRTVRPAWGQQKTLADVVLFSNSDGQATAIDPSATAIQVVRAPISADAQAPRQPTLLFPPSFHATLQTAQGASPLPMLHVRAFEYTVGPDGPAAMPGDLPPNSAYTHAVEFQVDEEDSGGGSVVLDKPAIYFTENFLHFPVGSAVPAGSYDRTAAAWGDADSGRIIRVLDTAGAMATLDLDGSKKAASPEALAGLGITDGERAQLASLYAAGSELWRVPPSHLSAWDLNWGIAPPADARRSQRPGLRPRHGSPEPALRSLVDPGRAEGRRFRGRAQAAIREQEDVSEEARRQVPRREVR